MYKRILIFICIIGILLTASAFQPSETIAQTNPWDPYAPYIPDNTPVVKRHLRGAWISTVINLDWPSADTKKIADDAQRVQKSKEELVTMLDKAVELKLNAVFFQVSPEGDALYRSAIVPWSRYLTGSYGKDPGFDPLGFAIDEAHKRNLEIHAWFNPYRISMYTDDATKATLNVQKSVYKEHPEWVRSAAGRLVIDPGVPAARNWVISRIMEVVGNYDIDGVHMDDYFYNESYVGEMKDTPTYNQYNNGQFSNIGDWRRNNTYLLVRELSRQIRAAKPWVKFGISPAGVWGNKSDGHPEGSNTSSGYTNYDRDFADTRKWVLEELLDYIAPQVYFSFGNTRAPYGEVASWWVNVCKGKNVHLYIGQALYKINDDSDQYFTGNNAVPEIVRQLKFNIVKPEIKGSIMFRFRNFYDAGKQQAVSVMQNDIWAVKALVPVMPWKGGKAPRPALQGKVENLAVSGSGSGSGGISGVATGGVKVSWTGDDPSAAYYAVYRFNNGEKADIASDASASKLIGTVRRTASTGGGPTDSRYEFIDASVSNYDNIFYVVTALDRLHNESGGLVVSRYQSKYFPDVTRDYYWAVDAIDRLYEIGTVTGDTRGLFNPGAATKRGDFILMVVRALNLQADFSGNFTDVTKSSYYYDAIGIAKALGIAKGSGTTFNPGGSITREDMMVIIARALEAAGSKLEAAGPEYLAGYSDAGRINAYARDAVASLTKAGLVEGSGGKVNPKSLATRAQLAVIIYRMLNQLLGTLV